MKDRIKVIIIGFIILVCILVISSIVFLNKMRKYNASSPRLQALDKEFAVGEKIDINDIATYTNVNEKRIDDVTFKDGKADGIKIISPTSFEVSNPGNVVVSISLVGDKDIQRVRKVELTFK